jgi:hypothetical protein
MKNNESFVTINFVSTLWYYQYWQEVKEESSE